MYVLLKTKQEFFVFSKGCVCKLKKLLGLQLLTAVCADVRRMVDRREVELVALCAARDRSVAANT